MVKPMAEEARDRNRNTETENYERDHPNWVLSVYAGKCRTLAAVATKTSTVGKRRQQ
jgi:hypothetical protein